MNRSSLPSFNKKNRLVGFYCWAGPATIRMTKTKYFDPVIDEPSMMESYDLEYIQEAKKKLGITDFWATYSWGYNSATEKQDYAFLLSKLPNFKKADVRVHAYIQGTNLVYDEYLDQDVWARDNFGRYISYYKGRRLTCVNNPHFQKIFYDKVTEAATHDFDGIFIDNVHMGQMAPFFKNKPLAFLGCRCHFCQKLFKEQTGLAIPRFLHWAKSETMQTYLDFRVHSMNTFLQKAADIAHKKKKLFSSNSYDPKFDERLVYGLNYQQLSEFQDYLLFETHSFPKENNVSRNSPTNQIAQNVDIPVFTVSYRGGIGFDSQLSQNDMQMLHDEADSSAFNVCYKGSEFISDGVWHNLRLEEIRGVTTKQPPSVFDFLKLSKRKGYLSKLSRKMLVLVFAVPSLIIISNILYGVLMSWTMEKKRVRPLMAFVYRWLLR